MEFSGFTKKDFDTFSIDGLEERMEAIQTRIQPKFQAIGDLLTDQLSEMTGNQMYLHIAKHARRTVNPPKDTWSAYCHNKRGYKKHPHFQIGLFDDHLFIWLAYIYELPNKSSIAESFLNHINDIKSTVPKDFVISQDHMKKDAITLENIDLEKALDRLKNVKKAEFLIGKHFRADDPILKDEHLFIDEVVKTFNILSPIYKLSME